MIENQIETGPAANNGKTIDDQWSEAFSETQPPPQQSAAKPASFNTLKTESTGSVANLEMILDIPITISVEIGRTRMLVNELLQLGQGTVVELEKLAGEPMEILVNGKLIARGEAVVVNEKFGVKLTDIVSPTERINKLK